MEPEQENQECLDEMISHIIYQNYQTIDKLLLLHLEAHIPSQP